MAISFISGPRDGFNWTKNECNVVLQSDINNVVYNVRVRIAIQIFFGDLSTDQFFDEEVVDGDGKVYFEVSGIIDEAIKNTFTPPDAESTNMNAVADAPTAVSIYWYEFADGVLITAGELAGFGDGLPYQFLKGGISPEFINSLTTVSDLLFIGDGDATHNRFLTWMPKYRMVDKRMLSPLYFLLPYGAETVTAFIKVFAGSTQILGALPPVSLSGIGQGVYYFNAGWESLNLDTLVLGDPLAPFVTHYTIVLFDISDSVMSETITFYLDGSYRKNKTYLHYQNSLNGFDDIRLTGEIATKGAYDRSISMVSESNSQLKAKREVFEVTETFGKKVNTGYLSPKECDALRELLISPRIFEYTDDGRVRPIILTESTKELVKSGDSLNGIFIDYVYDTDNRVYTPNPAER